MAWISKDPANIKIELRDEPYLTPEMETKLREVYMPRYEHPKGALLPALHMVQHAYGWVPPQAMKEIATVLGVAPSEVLDTVSFYEEYWERPKGEHLISVCRSIACEFCDATACTEAIKAKLDIDVGQTTEDGKFTLIELECLGSCGTAPVALIDDDLHENISPERICGLIDEVRAGTYKAGGSGAVKEDL